MVPRAARLLSVTAATGGVLLAGCGGEEKSGGSDTGAATGRTVAVQAGDSTCVLDRTALDAGTATFAVRNTGSKVTEVYVYGQQGTTFTRIISEVENIGPGTSREMTVSLPAGTYQVACKPGQTGDGIRTTITVAGAGGSPAAEPPAAYDREVPLATDGVTISGSPGRAKTGEAIEFKLTNRAAGPRTLELKDPTGKVAGEVADIAPGATGELIVDLAVPGQWKIIVEGGTADITAPLTVS